MTQLIVSHGDFTPQRLAYILGWLADHLETMPSDTLGDPAVREARGRLRQVLGGEARSPG